MHGLSVCLSVCLSLVHTNRVIQEVGDELCTGVWLRHWQPASERKDASSKRMRESEWKEKWRVAIIESLPTIPDWRRFMRKQVATSMLQHWHKTGGINRRWLASRQGENRLVQNCTGCIVTTPCTLMSFLNIRLSLHGGMENSSGRFSFGATNSVVLCVSCSSSETFPFAVELMATATLPNFSVCTTTSWIFSRTKESVSSSKFDTLFKAETHALSLRFVLPLSLEGAIAPSTRRVRECIWFETKKERQILTFFKI